SVEIHELFLLRTDLMNEDVVKPRIDVLADAVQMYLGIGSARNYFCDLVNRNQFCGFLEERGGRQLREELSGQAHDGPDLVRELLCLTLVRIEAYMQLAITRLFSADCLP